MKLLYINQIEKASSFLSIWQNRFELPIRAVLEIDGRNRQGTRRLGQIRPLCERIVAAAQGTDGELARPLSELARRNENCIGLVQQGAILLVVQFVM